MVKRTLWPKSSVWIAVAGLFLLSLGAAAATRFQGGPRQDDPGDRYLPLVYRPEETGSPGGGFWDSLYLLQDNLPGRLSGDQVTPAGQTLVIGPISGPGIIRHLWFTLQDDSPLVMRELVLRMYWDEEGSPSVESPWGDFFGVGHAQAQDLNTLPLVMVPDENEPVTGPGRAAVNCYFPMPFVRSARIEIENPTTRTMDIFYQVDYEQVPALPSNAGYFHAHWRRESPVQDPSSYTVLEAEGAGTFVGLVWSIIPLAPGSWAEGCENWYVDGALEPTLAGTGLEDYFGQSWGFRKGAGSIYSGASLGPLGDVLGPTSAYRFHLADPVRFQHSLRVEMLNRGWDPGQGGWYWRQDDFATVAYWYQGEPHRPFEPLPGLADRIAGLAGLPRADVSPTPSP